MDRIETVLVVDDDECALEAMRRGLELARKVVGVATNAIDAPRVARQLRPELAIVDLRLGASSGIDVLRALVREHADLRAVIVSGYVTIPLTVEAVKAGAAMVFAKPVTPRYILERVASNHAAELDFDETPTLARVQYEHILRVVTDCGGNISKAARRLGLHRQSLQRRLRNPAPSH